MQDHRITESLSPTAHSATSLSATSSHFLNTSRVSGTTRGVHQAAYNTERCQGTAGQIGQQHHTHIAPALGLLGASTDARRRMGDLGQRLLLRSPSVQKSQAVQWLPAAWARLSLPQPARSQPAPRQSVHPAFGHLLPPCLSRLTQIHHAVALKQIFSLFRESHTITHTHVQLPQAEFPQTFHTQL